MDHHDTLTKLDEVPEREGEPPGQLLDAGEGLDSWVRRPSTLLLPFETHKQLGCEKKPTSACLSYCVAVVGVLLVCVTTSYLLQAEHQSTSALYLIRLPGSVHRLLDDVSKVIVELRTKKNVVRHSNATNIKCLLAFLQ